MNECENYQLTMHGRKYVVHRHIKLILSAALSICRVLNV